jgi:hypothetical protein
MLTGAGKPTGRGSHQVRFAVLPPIKLPVRGSVGGGPERRVLLLTTHRPCTHNITVSALLLHKRRQKIGRSEK